MAEQSNHDFGRKVFFLCPSFSMKNTLIPKLIENEYETYVIKNYVYAKDILRKYPASICFVNIDDDLSHDGWFNFIASCETDETLSGVAFGAISGHVSNQSLHSRFIGSLKLEAGFIPVPKNTSDFVATVCGILEADGAKGRRQYVRTNCSGEKSARILVQEKGRTYKLQILDISVAGAACSCSIEEKDVFVVNSIFRDACAELDGKTFTVDIVVYAVLPNENFCKLVLLFSQPVSYDVKQIVHGYIAQTFEAEINELEKECTPDESDYLH